MKTILLPILIVTLAGCAAVGPDYERAEVHAPPQWSEPVPGATGVAPLATWWQTFHDAELDSLMQRAVAANPDLRIAQARVREARAQFGFAEADLGPTADASGSAAREQASRNQPVLGSLPIPSDVPFRNNVYQAGFDASWEIDVFGGKRREAKAAQADVAAAVSGRRAALVTLLGEVARTYLDVRGTQRRLVIAAEAIRTQEQVLAVSTERVAHGLTSDLDVEQAATLLATTRAEVPPLDGALRISIHRLGVLIGQPPGALLAELLPEAPIPTALPMVPVGLPSELLQRRPDVERAERQIAAATAQIGVAKADLFPRFFLTGSAGVESISTRDLFSSSSSLWSIGPSIQWRIFDTGRVRAQIRVQDARLEQAQAAYDQAILAAFEDVENALVAYAKEQQRHRSLADAVTTSVAALKLANELYANGLTDFLRVLDAERTLHQSQDQLVVSDRAVSADLIALYKALGGGWQTLDAEGSSARIASAGR
jgi:NodT family efflux transporter outer membrane factor (OMF) lipoprotein